MKLGSITEAMMLIMEGVMKELNCDYQEAVVFISRCTRKELEWMRQQPESENSHVSQKDS